MLNLNQYNKVWVTSDNHFGHTNILKFCQNTRPYSSVEHMDQELIRYHNETVGVGDATIFVGDFSFHNADQTGKILRQMNGSKILVLGNHDYKNLRNGAFYQGRMAWVGEYFSGNVNGTQVVFFHFPIWEWDKMHRGSVHLHGHVHGAKVDVPGRIMDVGWDAHGRYLGLDEAIQMCLDKEVRKHHG